MKKFIYIFILLLTFCFFKTDVFADVSYDLVEKKIYLAINAKNIATAEFSCDNGSFSKTFTNDNPVMFGATMDLNILSQGGHYCKLTYVLEKSTKVNTNAKKTYIYVREPLNDTSGTCVSTNETYALDGMSEEENCKKNGCKWNEDCVPYKLNGTSGSSGTSSNSGGTSSSSSTNSNGSTSSSGNSSNSGSSSSGSSGSSNNDIYDASGEDLENCSVLGSFKTDLENILDAFKIFSVCFASVVTAYEYLSVVFMKNADDLKKANTRLVKRLCLIAALWVLPSLLNILLGLVDSGTCIS